MKLVISEAKTGKSYQVEISEDKQAFVVGKKMGEKLDGSHFNANGYEFEITGGSDSSGFPMRKDIYGARKTRAYLSGGIGFKPKRDGERRKKMVRGNEVSSDMSQVNVKVIVNGEKPLGELFGKKTGDKKE